MPLPPVPEEGPDPAKETLAGLPEPIEPVEARTPVSEVARTFAENGREYLAVVEDGYLLGLCAKGEIGARAAAAADPAAFGREAVRHHLLPDPLVLPVTTPVNAALSAAFSRKGAAFHHDILVVDAGPEQDFLGVISLRAMVDLQSRVILRQMERLTQKESMLRQALTEQFRHSVEMRRAQKRDHELHEELRQAVQQQFRTSLDLRRSQAHYQILFQNSAVGVALLNTSAETTTYNRHFATLLGLPEPASHAKFDIGDYMPMSARAEFLSALQRLEGLPADAPPATLEVPIEGGAPGQAAPVQAKRLRVALSWIPETTQICLCAVDITEERNLQKRILEQEKDVLLESLMGGIAHELNNKASPLLGYSEMLSAEATGSRDPEKIAHYAEVIRKSSQEFAAIVHQLLQLVRPGSGKPGAIDLGPVVRETLGLMAFQIGDAKITVVEQFPAQPVAVVADANQVKQILINLVLNAVEAMRTSFQKELTCRLRACEGNALVEIQDTGTGIAPEILPRIFDPFFTSKSAETARGLGLSVSRSLARQYRGEILVDTKPGEGSTFTLRFPLTAAVPAKPAAPAPPQDAAPAPVPAPADAPARVPEILVVDDEENVGNLVKEILKRKFKGNVERAMNGEEAVKAIESRARAGDGLPFDLVISDVRMPVKNGLELFRWVAANQPKLVDHFMFMTGHDGTNEMSEEIGRSNVPILRKPFPIDVLVQAAQDRMAK